MSSSLNPSDKTTTITLDGWNNLRAWAAGSTYEAQVRSTTSHANGAWHVEFFGNNLTAGADVVGFAQGDATHTMNGLSSCPYIGADLTSIGFWNNPALILNTVTVEATGGAWSTGQFVALEVDFDAKNISYNVAGAGWSVPYNFATMSKVPYFVGVGPGISPNGITVNFGVLPFQITPQAGFNAWDALPPARVGCVPRN